MRELFDIARVLSGQPLPDGGRVAIVANAASPAGLALDGVLAAGLQPAAIVADTRAELRRHLPAEAMVGLPGGSRDVSAAIAASATTSAKPVLAVVPDHDDGPLEPGSRIPAFAFPEPAVAVLGRIVRYARWRSRPAGVVPDLADLDAEAAEQITMHALSARPTGTLLPLAAAETLLAAYGIPFAPARAVTDLGAAVAAGHDLGYPVALRAAAMARAARSSESGGVALDIQDPGELARAYERMEIALGSAMAEAVVQCMAPSGVETTASVETHPTFGPVVSFGLGGAFADHRRPPGPRSAADRSRRGGPRGILPRIRRAHVHGADVDALIELLLRLGCLADDRPELRMARFNPILASPAGPCVLQADIHLSPPPTPPLEPVRVLV